MTMAQDGGREYVEQMRAEGYSDADIREALVDAGWSEEQIRGALAGSEEGPPPPPPPADERRVEREPVRAKSGSGTGVWVIVLVGCLGLTVVVGAVVAAIMFPVFARAREKARQTSCAANLKQVGLAHMMYVQDHHDHFPPAADWAGKVHPYIKNPQVYLCPSSEETSQPTWQGNPVSYTMHGAVGGMSISTISAPQAVPLCYDGSALAGGVNDVTFRHNMGANCVYADGHATWVSDSAWQSEWRAPTAGPAAPSGPPPTSGPGAAPGAVAPGTSPEPSNFARAREKARTSACVSNLKQVSLAMLMYSQDYDETMPLKERWPEALQPYLRNNELFVCPSDESPHATGVEGWPLSYTFSERLDGTNLRNIRRSAAEVAIFDGDVLSGGREDAQFRHEGDAVVGFADGHVRPVTPEEWDEYWEEMTSGE